MKNKEFDINRGGYDKKVEEIRKQKRKLRDVQEPGLVKKIKKELKTEQRGAKHSDKHNLKQYLRESVKTTEELIDDLREMLFGHTDETALPIIDEYLDDYPQLLEIHDREWYYDNC